MNHFEDFEHWFVGDRCGENGNDQTIYERLRVHNRSYEVKTTKEIFILVLSFCLLYLIYLLLYGIIPRYSIGLLVSIIGFISITTGNLKINLNQFTLYLIIFISVVLIVRIDSYLYAFGNEKPKYQNFDASNAVQYKRFNENWVVPIQGDQCWINIDCSMAESNIELIDNGFFKTAFKEN